MRFSNVLQVTVLTLACLLTTAQPAGIGKDGKALDDPAAARDRQDLKPGSHAYAEKRNAVFTAELMKFHRSFDENLSYPDGRIRVLSNSELEASSQSELSVGLHVVKLGNSDYQITFRPAGPIFNPTTRKEEDGQSPIRVKASDIQRLANQSRNAALVLEQLDKITFIVFPDLVRAHDSARRILNYKAADGAIRIEPPVLNLKIGSGTSAVASAVVRDHVRNSGTVILSGDQVPDHFLSVGFWVRDFVFQSPRSSNRTSEQLFAATDFGDRPFATRPHVVLNALPNADGLTDLPKMLRRMKLSVLHMFAWRETIRDVRQTIADSNAFNSNTRVATRENVLNELQTGNSNVLMLIAHNLKRRIYFPDGSSIGFDEFASIRRSSAPDRAIVLVTCQAGEIGGDVPSLAEVMLQNNLAKTVFASDAPVTASTVAEMIKAVSGEKDLRKSLNRYGLSQIVINGNLSARPVG